MELVVREPVKIELRYRGDYEGVLVDQPLPRLLCDAITVLDDVDAAIESVSHRLVADAVGADLKLVEMRFLDQRLHLLQAVGGNLLERIVSPRVELVVDATLRES